MNEDAFITAGHILGLSQEPEIDAEFESGQTVTDATGKGREALAAGLPTLAARHYREALVMAGGDDPEIRLELAAALEASGDFALAHRQFLRVARSVQCPEAHAGLSTTYAAFAKNRKAVEMILKAAELSPGTTRYWLRASELQTRSGMPKAALQSAKRAFDQNPDDGHAAHQLGDLLLKLKMFEEAKPVLEKAVELLPQDDETQLALALALWGVGQRDKAVARVRLASDIHPGQPLFHSLIRLMLFAMGQHEDAQMEEHAASRIDAHDLDRLERIAKVIDLPLETS